MVLLFEISLYIAACFGVLMLVGSSIYDVRSVKRRKRIQPRRQLASTTILVYARNNAKTIEQCLQSVATMRMNSDDIVVVDDRSQDDTGRIVRRYQRTHPHLRLRLYTKRVVNDRAALLRQAYRRSHRGDIVAVIDANSRMDKTLASSLAMFAGDRGQRAVRFPLLSHSASQLGLLVGYFTGQNRMMYSKMISLMPRQAVVPFGRSGCAHRVQVYKSRRTVPRYAFGRYEAAYGAVEVFQDGLVMEHNQSTDLSERPWYKSVVALLAITWSLVVCLWAMQLAAALQTGAPLLTLWIVAILWLVMVILSDDRTRWVEKIGYISSTPIFILMTYIYVVMRGISKVYLHARTCISHHLSPQGV